MALGQVVLRDGRTLAYAEVGDPNGTPVIYLHGAKSSRLETSVFDEQARARGVRLVSTSRPGCGTSTPSPKRSFLSYSNDLAELADELGLSKFVVAGMSNGGAYALAAGHALPERVVGVLMINSTTPTADRAARRVLPIGARIAYAAMRHTPGVLARISSRPGPPTARDMGPDAGLLSDPAIAAQVQQTFLDVEGPYASTYLKEEIALGAADWGFDHRSVQQPVRIFSGEQDAGLAYTRVWAAELPNAALHVIPGGHSGFLAPAARAEIIDAMVSLSSGAPA